MSDVSATAAGIEARQAMVRVWLAISAVWVTFWLLIAAIAIAPVEVRYSLTKELGAFSLIVITPPLCLLALGAAGRWFFETAVRTSARLRPLRCR